MSHITRWVSRQRSSLGLAVRALRAWGPRQVVSAVVAAVVVGAIIGLATVLIPNPIFGREVPPVAWNYPVWIATSVLTGVLVATYVQPAGSAAGDDASAGSGHAAGGDDSERRSARVGGVAGVLAWFAVGCPVCNKIAVLALGSSGALTWFAPVQPFLAVVALVLSTVAVVWRLRGQVACPTPASRNMAMS